jgi:hypothetical protein
VRFIFLASAGEPVYDPAFSPRLDARHGALFAIEHLVCRYIVRRSSEFSRDCGMRSDDAL